MKFRQIKNKIQKIFRGTTRDKALLDTLLNRIKYPRPKNSTFQSVLPLFESGLQVTVPTFPNKDWLMESFNSIEGNPSRQEQGSSSIFDSSFTEDLEADANADWEIYMWAEGAHNFVQNMPLEWDYGYNIVNGGEEGYQKHYRCSVSAWRGWEDELADDGTCPINPGENVIENPIKYFECEGYSKHDYATWSGGDVFMRTTTGMEMTYNFGILACNTEMRLKIDRINFTASGDYTGTSAGLVGGALRIIVHFTSGLPIIYQYELWSEHDTDETDPINALQLRYFNSNRILLSLSELNNFDRNLFEDYQTIFGETGTDEDAWRAKRISSIQIIPDTYVAVKNEGVTNAYVESEFTFDIDNIRLEGTENELVTFNYEFETPPLQLTEDLLPFVESQVLAKMDEEYHVTLNNANFRQQKLWVKMGTNLYKFLLKGRVFIHKFYEEWEDLVYPQVNLLLALVPPHNFDDIQKVKIQDNKLR